MVGSNLKGTQLQQIVDKTMRSVDCDQDGKISFEEFCQIVGKTDFDKKLQDVTVWREDKLFTLHILKLKSNIFIELAYLLCMGHIRLYSLLSVYFDVSSSVNWTLILRLLRMSCKAALIPKIHFIKTFNDRIPLPVKMFNTGSWCHLYLPEKYHQI